MKDTKDKNEAFVAAYFGIANFNGAKAAQLAGSKTAATLRANVQFARLSSRGKAWTIDEAMPPSW